MNSPSIRLAWRVAIALCAFAGLHAEDLSPRAYVITPVRANAVILTWSYFDGGLNFNGTVPIAGASVFANHGQRVLTGYRVMQPASDMFLGWTESLTRHFFIRQLRDIKISIRVESFGSAEMGLYAAWCGRALALSHSRSGCSATLSGYMGKSDTFDQAITDFASVYGDQNEKDHAALERAVRSGKVKAEFEEAR